MIRFGVTNEATTPILKLVQRATIFVGSDGGKNRVLRNDLIAGKDRNTRTTENDPAGSDGRFRRSRKKKSHSC